jgi:exopolyphosphatase / guanosine-5'-triphosphate,3'-diphosphate pyrophosphatase
MSWRAAVDIGTVSAKILLTDGSQRVRHGVDTLIGGSRLASNGEVMAETISDEGLARLEGALAEFRALVDRYQVADLRALTTAPGRHARNRGALAALVERHLGIPLEVVDGVNEGRLAYLGVCSDPALRDTVAGLNPAGEPGPTPKVVTIDIGGGSTEFAAGAWSTAAGTAWPEHVFSVPIGGRSISAAYLRSDPPRADELSSALSIVELHLDDVQREAPDLLAGLDSAVVVGLGAVVTMAAIEIGLGDEDPHRGEGDGPLHGFVLTREAAEDVFRTIATETRAARLHNPGLPPTRVDEIVGAATVLVEILRQLGLSELMVSQRGLLDGVLVGPGPGPPSSL